MREKDFITKLTGVKISLLKFLERTKNGDYAPINEESLKYVRIKEESDITENFDNKEYYYSIT